MDFNSDICNCGYVKSYLKLSNMDKWIIKKPKLDKDVEPSRPESASSTVRNTKDLKQKNKSTKGTTTQAKAQPSPSTSKDTVSHKTENKNTDKHSRQFQQSWCSGRKWLKYDGTNMRCQFCVDNETKIRHLLKTRNMITGVSSYRKDVIDRHEKTEAHKHAEEIVKNAIASKQAPAFEIVSKMDKNNQTKLEHLFRNVHALVKHNKSLTDYAWVCVLDEQKGVDIGQSYRTNFSAQQFAHVIASHEKCILAETLKDISFISITCDGSTDSASKEQEIVFVQYCHKGNIFTKFIGIDTPERADADGILKCMLGIFTRMDPVFNEDFLQKKLVAIGCDGAAVMTGRKDGVAKKLQGIQPALITVHCHAHRCDILIEKIYT